MNILQLVGVAGLVLLAVSAFAAGILNGCTPARFKNQALWTLGVFMLFAAVFSALAIIGVLSMRDSRTVNLMGSFIFLAFMAELFIDARAARKAIERTA